MDLGFVEIQNFDKAQKISDKFDGAPYSECFVIGFPWKMGEAGNELIGLTAQGYYCPIKAISTEPIEPEDFDGDEEW